MDRIPDSLSIAFWVVGSCCGLALLAYVFGQSPEWIFPLFMFGVLTGLAEWVMRRNLK
jgi:hypothetical protein